MGTGTNVQKRLVALHHLDAPWKPAEVEQREGRILRQGNSNEEVAIYRYVTEGSFDAYMWQALETKARFIGQVMTGDNATRRAEDIGEADAELQRLAILRRNHSDEQYLAGKAIRDLPGTIERLESRLAALSADRATTIDHGSEPLTITGRSGDATAGLSDRLDTLPEKVRETRRFPIGRYRGLDYPDQKTPRVVYVVSSESRRARIAGLCKKLLGEYAVVLLQGKTTPLAQRSTSCCA